MKETEIVVQKTTYGEAHLAIGDGIPRPLTTVINCKKIILAQESIGVEIDVSESFERIDTIVVNGVEYRKVGADNEQRKADCGDGENNRSL